MALKDLVPMPPAVPINRYLWSKIAELDPDLVIDYEGILPFFPLGETAAGDSPWDGKPSVVYDRMMVSIPILSTPSRKSKFTTLSRQTLQILLSGVVLSNTFLTRWTT